MGIVGDTCHTYTHHLLSSTARDLIPLTHLTSMELHRFLLGLCAFLQAYGSVSTESTCKLKAKFNLNSYKDVKKKVTVGGMFSVHQRIVSATRNTSTLPVSSGCEG